MPIHMPYEDPDTGAVDMDLQSRLPNFNVTIPVDEPPTDPEQFNMPETGFYDNSPWYSETPAQSKLVDIIQHSMNSHDARVINFNTKLDAKLMSLMHRQAQ